MNNFYNSDEMFEQAAAISNNKNYKQLLQNNIYVTRQACKNIFSRLCMHGPYKCYIYMDELEAQGLSDLERIICTSIIEEEGITVFKTEDSEYELDDLSTDVLISMIEQL